MRKNIELSIGALLFGCIVAACSGGGGGSSLPAAPRGATPNEHLNVAFTITIPSAATSAVRSPKYVSASTKSVSIVETDGTASPSPAVVQNTTPGSPNCTTSSGSTSCTITVLANVGADSFTVKTFDQPGAAGNMLSDGTVKGTVVSGQANSFPLTLSGTVASFTLIASEAYPQVGGTATITAQAKDAGGNTIIGTYDSPIALTTTGSATLDAANIASSSDQRTLTLSNSQTAAFTVNGSVNGKSASLTINPSSGIVYYNVGSGSLDVTGFNIITGNDGKLYYTALGLLTCGSSGGICYGNSGVLGQFDPSSGNYTEIPLASNEPVAPFQTADGAVWVSLSSTTVVANRTVATGYVGRVAGAFNASDLSTIPLPTPSPFDNASRPRSFALGADGNLYLTGNGDHNIYKIPVSNPSTSNITAIPLPSYTAPPGAVWNGSQKPYPQGITTGPDGNLYIANFSFNAPSVLQYNTASAALTAFAPPNGQGPSPRYVVAGSDGNIYESYGGTCQQAAPCYGGLNAMTTAGAFTQIGLPDGYSEPDDLASGNGFVAFVDLGEQGFGTYSVTSKEVRDYPIEPINAGLQCCTVWTAPNGITVGSDGSLWYITYGAVSTGGPLAIAHVVMTSNWSVWPSQKMNLIGSGNLNAQLVGIMESGDSSPFTVSSSNGNVAVLQPITGESHDFHLVGVGAGSCTVTIADKNGRTESIAVTVTTTNGTVQIRRAANARASHGGLL